MLIRLNLCILNEKYECKYITGNWLLVSIKYNNYFEDNKLQSWTCRNSIPGFKK